MLSIKMITSGLLVQNRAHFRGFPSSYRQDNDVYARPYVDGFDTGIVRVSEPFKIENGLPPVIPPSTVNYRNIFGRGSTADEREFYLNRGMTMKQAAASQMKAGRGLRRAKNQKTGTYFTNAFDDTLIEQNGYKSSYKSMSGVSGAFPTIRDIVYGRGMYYNPPEDSSTNQESAQSSISRDSMRMVQEYLSALDKALNGSSEASSIVARMNNLGLRSPTSMDVAPTPSNVFKTPSVSTNAMDQDPKTFERITVPMSVDIPPPPPIVNEIPAKKIANTKAALRKGPSAEQKEINVNGKTEDLLGQLKKGVKLKKTSGPKKSETQLSELEKTVKASLAKRRVAMEDGMEVDDNGEWE